MLNMTHKGVLTDIEALGVCEGVTLACMGHNKVLSARSRKRYKAVLC